MKRYLPEICDYGFTTLHRMKRLNEYKFNHSILLSHTTSSTTNLTELKNLSIMIHTFLKLGDQTLKLAGAQPSGHPKKRKSMTFRTIVRAIWTECQFWNNKLHVNLGPREFMLQGSVFLVTEVGVNGVHSLFPRRC